MMIAPKGHDISQIAPKPNAPRATNAIRPYSERATRAATWALRRSRRAIASFVRFQVAMPFASSNTKESTFDETVHCSIPPSTPQMGKVTKNFLVWAIPDIMSE